MRAYCLTVHASYRCRHSGACCTAGWPIFLEAAKLPALQTGGLVREWSGYALPSAARDAAVLLARTNGGACVFYAGAGEGRCAIHRTLGEAVLPVACRNFPRVTLRNPRGLFITLSHFCPTAARLLLDAGPIAIVDAPVSISLTGEAEGLDGSNVLPPLLRSDMLTDWDGYGAWEREGVATLNDPRWSAQRALEIVAAATSAAQRWSPDRGPLAMAVAEAFRRARHRQSADRSRAPFDRPLKAFLAAHLFASWAAYGRSGLDAVVDALHTALSLAGTNHRSEEGFLAAVRAADRRLRHAGHHARADRH